MASEMLFPDLVFLFLVLVDGASLLGNGGSEEHGFISSPREILFILAALVGPHSNPGWSHDHGVHHLQFDLQIAFCQSVEIQKLGHHHHPFGVLDVAGGWSFDGLLFF